jgi:acylphosphatase
VTPRIVARRLVVAGRVQGVGFREAAVDEARAAGLAGWVRNRADGTVEAFVQGETGDVERFAAWCRHGPRLARVDAVAIEAADPDPSLDGFRRVPTA